MADKEKLDREMNKVLLQAFHALKDAKSISAHVATDLDRRMPNDVHKEVVARRLGMSLGQHISHNIANQTLSVVKKENISALAIEHRCEVFVMTVEQMHHLTLALQNLANYHGFDYFEAMYR